LVESPNYEVTRKLDNVEIRKYPSIFLATAKGDADLFGARAALSLNRIHPQILIQ
jgi:hypothetical protein